MSAGKNSAGELGFSPLAGGYRPTQAAQQQFQSGMPQPQPQPGVAQQLTQIAGGSNPATSTMVNQQMAPSGATGLPPVMGMSSQQSAQPYNNGFVPTGDSFIDNLMQQNQQVAQTQQQNFNALPQAEQQQRLTDQSNFLTQQQAAQKDFFGSQPGGPIGLPNGQQLDMNPQAQDPQSLMNQINWETMRTMGLLKQS